MTLQTPPKATRDSNIELLRVVLMLMIIGYHLIVHGAKVGGPDGDYTIAGYTSVAYLLLKCFLVIAVNCFVFISGYYRINFRMGTVVSLILQTSFYALGIQLVFSAITGAPVILGLSSLPDLILPIFKGTWWFITGYFGLYLVSPLLNMGIDACTRPQLLFVVVIFTVLNAVSGFLFGSGGVLGSNGGYSLFSFIHIYLIGRYAARFIADRSLRQWSAAVYLLSSLALFLLVYLSISRLDNLGIARLFKYNNPLILISAISFFFFFKSFRLQSPLVNRLAAGVLGVYLLHDHRLVREHVIENLYAWSLNFPGYLHFLTLLLITVSVFMAGFLVDKAREMLLDPVARYAVEQLGLHRIDRIFGKEPAREVYRQIP